MDLLCQISLTQIKRSVANYPGCTLLLTDGEMTEMNVKPVYLVTSYPTLTGKLEP